MAGPGNCVLCLTDTCTSEGHPVFNTVAPYEYLVSDMYLFIADITTPDLFVESCRTWIGIDIARFCEQKRHQAGPQGSAQKTVNRAPISGGRKVRYNLHSSLSPLRQLHRLYAVSFGANTRRSSLIPQGNRIVVLSHLWRNHSYMSYSWILATKVFFHTFLSYLIPSIAIPFLLIFLNHSKSTRSHRPNLSHTYILPTIYTYIQPPSACSSNNTRLSSYTS